VIKKKIIYLKLNKSQTERDQFFMHINFLNI